MPTLYDYARAPSPRRARILLAEKGIAHDTVMVRPGIKPAGLGIIPVDTAHAAVHGYVEPASASTGRAVGCLRSGGDALDKRVEVFIKPFRVRRDVTLLATPEAQKLLAAMTTLTITGALEYQACDDKVCFNPTRVPISFVVSVKGLDRRPPAAP